MCGEMLAKSHVFIVKGIFFCNISSLFFCSFSTPMMEHVSNCSLELKTEETQLLRFCVSRMFVISQLQKVKPRQNILLCKLHHMF